MPESDLPDVDRTSSASSLIHSIKDIAVECSPDDAIKFQLDGLVLTIMDVTNPRPLRMEKTSIASWNQGNDDQLFVPIHGHILVIASSPGFGDLGYLTIDSDTCSGVSTQMTLPGGAARGSHLLVVFESAEDLPKLSLSFDIKTFALKDILDDKSQGYLNPLVLLDVVQKLPDDDPTKIDALQFCADQLEKVFTTTQDEDDIRAAIEIYEDVAGRLTPDDRRFASYRNNVGLAYKKCQKVSGKLEDIDAAIAYGRQTVSIMPDGHPLTPALLSYLGGWISDRFKSTCKLEDISEAIEVLQRAVTLTPAGHPALVERLNNLGNAFLRRFELTGQLNDIFESIEKLLQGVKLASDTLPDLPAMLSNLGGAYSQRFGRAGNLSDISEAISHGQRGLQLAPEGHPLLPGFLTNLGISFSLRFQAAGDNMDISEAIKLQQRALRLMPEGDPSLSATLTNLGKSFLLRFEHTGELSDISEAIEVQQQARNLIPDGHPELANQLNNLGSLITARFERSQDLGDISEAIRVQQQAVSLTPEGRASLPGFLSNLARSYFRRFERTGELSDISLTIGVLQRAVKLTPEGHTYLSEFVHELGIAFLCRFQRTDNPADIAQAVDLMQRAFSLTPEGHPERSIRLNNLGRLYLFCFQRSGEVRLFEFALSAFRQAAESSTGPPYVFLLAAKKWAELAKAQFAPPSELLNAHEHIIHLLSFNAGLESTLRRRHEVLLDSSQLSTAAAAAALSIGQLDKAVEWLEQGRCIVWNQINQLRSPLDDLRDHDPALADRLQLLSRQLETAGSRRDSLNPQATPSLDEKLSLQEQAHEHLRLARERDELLKTIRALPGFESFLQPQRFADLVRNLPKEGPTIIINATGDRCDALALVADCDQPIHIPLERFPYERAERLAKGLRSYLSSYRLRTRYREDPASESDARAPSRLRMRPSSEDSLQKLLSDLWTDLVEPILQTLAIQLPNEGEDLPRIWWCPTGPFAFLPIHAAGIYHGSTSTRGSCLADFAISSYIPTLSILTRLRSRPKPSSDKEGVLLVSQPDTPGLPSIPCTLEEIQKTQEQLNKRGIRSILYNSQNATISAVLKAMEANSCVHLACHASQEITNPLESAIHLYDGQLMLSEIMKKDLPDADLAFMSACQTSAGDEKLPEEAVHLAAGMLAAGYRSVVATMWSISDAHAPDVAETFYQNVLDDSQQGGEKLDGTRAAKALHASTQGLREKLGNSTGALLAWIPYIHVGI